MKSDADAGSSLRSSHFARSSAKALAAAGEVDSVATGFAWRAEREHATRLAMERRQGEGEAAQHGGEGRLGRKEQNRRQGTGSRQ